MTLTRESVLSMPAGAEMDALVAERVMGTTQYAAEWLVRGAKTPWRPSTDIAAAWEVVEKLKKCRADPHAEIAVLALSGDWTCGYLRHDIWTFGYSIEDAASASTAPLAICRAALLTTL